MIFLNLLTIITLLSVKVLTQPSSALHNMEGFLSPTSLLVQLGGTIQLKCYSRSEPTWYKGRTWIQKGGFELIVHGVYYGDMGQYSCEGTQWNGQPTRGVATVFIGIPRELLFPDDSTIMKDTLYHALRCNTTTPVRWFFNYRQIPLGWDNVYSAGINNQHLIFSPVLKRNTGIYSCYGQSSPSAIAPAFYSSASLEVVDRENELPDRSRSYRQIAEDLPDRSLRYQVSESEKNDKALSCSSPPQVPFATAIVEEHKGVKTANYTCRFKKQNIGGTMLKCTSEGKWYGRRPYCKASEAATLVYISWIFFIPFVLYNC